MLFLAPSPHRRLYCGRHRRRCHREGDYFSDPWGFLLSSHSSLLLVYIRSALELWGAFEREAGCSLLLIFYFVATMDDRNERARVRERVEGKEEEEQDRTRALD